MKTLMFKVDDTLSNELKLIKKMEGLGNGTATFTYIIKYYFLTKKRSLDEFIQLLDRALDPIDVHSLPSDEDLLHSTLKAPSQKPV